MTGCCTLPYRCFTLLPQGNACCWVNSTGFVRRTVFTAGWCLVFGGKPRAHVAGNGGHPPCHIRERLTVLGIVGQFYFTWARSQSHP